MQLKKSPASCGTFLLLVILVSGFYPSLLRAQASVEVVEAKKKFGIVHKGEKVEMKYQLVNTGKSPLIIQGHEVQCSCTTVKYDNKPVNPGDTAIVWVTFDTKTVYDRQDRTIDIMSNNKDGVVKLRFKGFVKRK